MRPFFSCLLSVETVNTLSAVSSADSFTSCSDPDQAYKNVWPDLVSCSLTLMICLSECCFCCCWVLFCFCFFLGGGGGI